MKFIKRREINDLMVDAKVFRRLPEIRKAVQINEPFQINSLEGILNGKPGDYIIQGCEGEYYICDQQIFKKTYKEK